MPKENWTIITDKQEIEDIIIKRNKIHLNQAQGTTCTVPPISTLLGQDSFTPFGDQILSGTADIDDLPLSEIQKRFFLSLKRKHVSQPIPNTLSRASMEKGFQKWKEKTSTSPSTRHL